MTTSWKPSLVSDELLALTRSLGEPSRDLAILAEGNTSHALGDGRLVVKASGANLYAATRADFVVVDVDEVAALLGDDRAGQDELTAVLDAGVHDGVHRRASIETLLHAAVQAISPVEFIGHTHPTAVLGLMASVHAATAYATPAYSDEAVVLGRPLFVPYAQPGFTLGRLVFDLLRRRVDETGELPALILLGNHGIVATAPTAAGVDGISAMAVKTAQVRLSAYAAGGLVPLPADGIAEFFARADISERRLDLRHAGEGASTT
jgi:rhamnose utilization protein RhaD (predicted bifunctional aldolase and dehydrogenase)